jgi:amino acid adenylation domain-containing protein
MSYQDLLDQAGKLADVVDARCDPGDLLALDSVGPAAGAIAILAAARGERVVLPLSADSPARHRAWVMADAGPALVIREDPPGIFAVEPAGTPERVHRSEAEQQAMRAVAYIMYTSGSTGRPKGVMVPHDALLSRVNGLRRTPGFGPEDSIVAMTALSFDISLAELLLPLTCGGCFIAAPAAARLDPEIFSSVVAAQRPSVIQATPSFWRLALAWGWRGTSSQTRLWCGGEALTPGLAAQLLPECAELWNVYGPTEATIWATAARVGDPTEIDLGKPLAGTGLCLEDESGRLVATPLHPGEILLYGHGLALGYLGQPQLTHERFRTCHTPDGRQLCYRTGDRARYRHDGSLEFLGRTDDQVKLRGHRIELGEVAAVAEEHPAVREAAAVLRNKDQPDKAHIALFAVVDSTLTTRDIRGWLRDRLPAGTRPGRIVILPSLPRTTAGKIDRTELAKSVMAEPTRTAAPALDTP